MTFRIIILRWIITAGKIGLYFPSKVYIQHEELKVNCRQDNHMRRILREASAKTTVGYQMVGGKGFRDRQIGDRLTAFLTALEDYASHLEVYASDVRDLGQRGALEFLSSRLERR
jgi:hypothetical protein